MFFVENCNHSHKKGYDDAYLEAQEYYQVGYAEVNSKVTLLNLIKVKLTKRGVEKSLEGLACGFVVCQAAEAYLCYQCEEDQIENVEDEEEGDFIKHLFNDSYELAHEFVIAEEVKDTNPEYNDADYPDSILRNIVIQVVGAIDHGASLRGN